MSLPDQRRRVRELRAGQLHAVARVAAESNGCFIEFRDGFRRESLVAMIGKLIL